MKIIQKFFIFFGITLCIYSCKEDHVEPTLNQVYKSYFPMVKGFYVDYDVDSVVHLEDDDIYNMDTSILSFHFQLREQVDSQFIDPTGDTTYTILRYHRDADSLPWDFINVWTAKVTNTSAQKVEDNVRFIKLAFPINFRQTWNGNAFNFFPEEDYTYGDIFVPAQFGAIQVDSAVTVIQDDFSSNINRIFKEEIYGSNIGMLSKELDSINIRPQPDGTILILNGIDYKLTIRDYKH